MKVLIPILIGLLVVGCGKKAAPDEAAEVASKMPDWEKIQLHWDQEIEKKREKLKRGEISKEDFERTVSVPEASSSVRFF